MVALTVARRETDTESGDSFRATDTKPIYFCKRRRKKNQPLKSPKTVPPEGSWRGGSLLRALSPRARVACRHGQGCHSPSRVATPFAGGLGGGHGTKMPSGGGRCGVVVGGPLPLSTPNPGGGSCPHYPVPTLLQASQNGHF